MRLTFKQRAMTLLSKYDIYDSDGNTVFVVEGQFSFAPKLIVTDADGYPLGRVERQLMRWRSHFDFYVNDQLAGTMRREFSPFHPTYTLDFNGWQVEGSFSGWNYRIVDANGYPVASVHKELMHWTDTYIIDVEDPANAMFCLMIVLSIDVEKAQSQS